MKTLNRICIFLIFIELFLTITSGCKKNEESPKFDPIISWDNPADIPFGTKLNIRQLNAIADVPGNFFYLPSKGAILNEGANQVLKVVFTPTDIATYNILNKTVKINVVKAGVKSTVFNSKITYSTLTDTEGNLYKTVILGTQTWMAENLRSTVYSDGIGIQEGKTFNDWKLGFDGGKYGNYSWDYGSYDNITTFGMLYDWWAVNSIHKLAPEGWHVPTKAEWIVLINYLGGENVAGAKMKEYGTTHWQGANIGATNESGFTGLPSGKIETLTGYALERDLIGYYWTSTRFGNSQFDPAYYMKLSYDNSKCSFDFDYTHNGFAVRCVKD